MGGNAGKGKRSKGKQVTAENTRKLNGRGRKKNHGNGKAKKRKKKKEEEKSRGIARNKLKTDGQEHECQNKKYKRKGKYIENVKSSKISKKGKEKGA